MITKSMVKIGYNTGIIKLIKSPNGDGIACQIGDNWFYFDVKITEQYDNVNEYKKDISEDIIIQEIYTTLKDFYKNKDVFIDEYLYYKYYLEEHLATEA